MSMGRSDAAVFLPPGSTGALDTWWKSRYTGLFRSFGAMPLRAHDPAISVYAGVPANRAFRVLAEPGAREASLGQEYAVGGAGTSDEEAAMAALGEAIERWQTHRLPSDEVHTARFAAWDLKEPAMDPERFVLFHQGQYESAGFPFVPLDRNAVCTWVRGRQAKSGAPVWLPAPLVYLDLRPGVPAPEFAPAVSSGMSAHCSPERALLRGVQELIERDALMGAWWRSYVLEEWPKAAVFAELAMLDHTLPPRIERPNLRYRFYRARSPYSEHVTIVTATGEDREGLILAAGSACRETRAESWRKAVIEAIQGRHYVRYLVAEHARGGRPLEVPTSFAEHALYYSVHPHEFARTPLASDGGGGAGAPPVADGPGAQNGRETLGTLMARLRAGLGAGVGACLDDDCPVFFRLMTPPALAEAGLGWVVMRVLIPGLQPMHGDHRLPLLGGALWGERPVGAWRDMPPHPFA